VTPKDVAATVTPLAQIYGAPFGNASAVPTYWCARLATKNGVHRLLAGDGGDELFGGNARYAKQKLFDYYRHVPGWLRGAVEPLAARFGAEGGVGPIRKLHRYIEQAKVPMPARLETYNLLLELGAANMLHPDFVVSIDTGRPERLQREWYDTVGAESLVNNMLGLDMKVTLADNDLPKVSVMCELAKLDVRYPLLSDALVEFALRLPASFKVKGLRLRYFFKEAFRDFLAPETLTKQKHGFGMPTGIWLARDADLHAMVRDAVEALTRRSKSPGSRLLDEYVPRQPHHPVRCYGCS
jgi:asparagine synthase (glutamine-hydrolysing)